VNLFVALIIFNSEVINGKADNESIQVDEKKIYITLAKEKD
jgi:hypothetical protein